MNEQKQIPKHLLDKFRRRLYTTEHKTGENNTEILGLDLHRPVFFFTAIAVIGFVLFALLLPNIANSSAQWYPRLGSQ